jgi:hypothetical protein
MQATTQDEALEVPIGAVGGALWLLIWCTTEVPSFVVLGLAQSRCPGVRTSLPQEVIAEFTMGEEIEVGEVHGADGEEHGCAEHLDHEELRPGSALVYWESG